MQALRPYPAYRESGFPWLGKVPAHWEVRPLKRIGSFSSGAGFPISAQGSTGDEILFVKVSDMNRFGNNIEIVGSANTVSRETALTLGAQIFEANTIIFPKVGGALLTNKRRMLVRPTCIDNNLMACIVTGANVQFAVRLLSWLDLARISKPGPVPAISEGEVREIRVALPSLSEQAAVVRFLDHADRRIRRSIRAKERLIALLEEQNRAAIHQAVTGRIDVRTGRPYPAYKPSGVEWLGEVPHHWNVRRLRQCGTMVGGMTPSMVDRRFWDGEIPWVTPKDMKREAIHDSGIRVTKAALRETSIRLIGPPAVLMVVRGMILARKVPIAWSTNCVTINQDMKAVVPAVGIKAEFLARALDSAQDALATLIDEAGHGTRRLPTERLRTLAVAIPSEDEQSLVVRFVDQTTTKLDKRIADARREVGLLREYRIRLIADVVTGKLDVREAAAALPEEPDDPAATEADYADPEGRDDDRPDHDWRTAVPATREEMTP